jgi:hypothetical protein
LITYTDLGRWSWLGNELFQYAALLGVAGRLGYDVRLPPSAQHHLGSLIELDTPTYTTAELRRLRYRFAQCYPYNGYEPALERIPDWCDIFGYFESPRHFPEDIELRRRYRIRADVMSKMEAIWDRLPHDRPIVGFHVRRGDNATATHWVHLGENGYYDRATECFSDLDVVFLLVSDDPEWCRANFRLPNALVADAAPAPVHLALLARCDHLILTNSTFSWWAAWFHEPRHGQVVSARRWYTEGGFDDDARERPAHWIEV